MDDLTTQADGDWGRIESYAHLNRIIEEKRQDVRAAAYALVVGMGVRMTPAVQAGIETALAQGFVALDAEAEKIRADMRTLPAYRGMPE